ncbi:MAG TPA: 16S rRNA (cytosine(1402)-N(4))-methyltransferase [Phycisphaerales bacterium]|nr:16S rRNA (cytosine(1402)-N(4))-methyltransferase [Phycisphaerales bacterium]
MGKRQSTNRGLRAKGRTPEGTHVPAMAAEVLALLDPQPGDVVVDCTIGYGGHARMFLERIGPQGRLIGLDIDGPELDRTRRRLGADGRVRLHRRNFAELPDVLKAEGIAGASVIFADLGVSSMQVDDATRGIGFKADGPLDMRMDDRIETTAADLLATLSEVELSDALRRLSDEPDHEAIARLIAGQRQVQPVATVDELVRLVLNAKGFTPRTWKRYQKQAPFGTAHPAARTFQALRILVNNDLTHLDRFLALAPQCLASGGRIGVLSFQPGEDRLVKQAFRDGYRTGVYAAIAPNVLRPRTGEIVKNPRSASARFRWARRA